MQEYIYGFSEDPLQHYIDIIDSHNDSISLLTANSDEVMMMAKDNIFEWSKFNAKVLNPTFNEISVDYKKVFNGVLDKFVNESLLESDNTFNGFVILICSSFIRGISKYVSYFNKKYNHNISTKDINFLYKGGNLIRFNHYAFQDLLKNDNSDHVTQFKKVFVGMSDRSDNDFGIIVDYSHIDRQYYDIVHDNLTTLSYMILAHIRGLIILYPNIITDYYKRSENDKQVIIKRDILDTLNASKINGDTYPKMNGAFVAVNFDGILVSDVVLNDEQEDEYSSIHKIGKGDLLVYTGDAKRTYIKSIIPPHDNPLYFDNDEAMMRKYEKPYQKYKKGRINIKPYINAFISSVKKANVCNNDVPKLSELVNKTLLDIFDDKKIDKNTVTPFNVSINTTLKFQGNSSVYGKYNINFNLVRMKLNMKALYINPLLTEKKYIMENLNSGVYAVSGEMIDITIMHHDDNKTDHFIHSKNQYISTYIMRHNETNYEVVGYSPVYLLFDLADMVLLGSDHPSFAKKIDKRFKRLMYMLSYVIYTDYHKLDMEVVIYLFTYFVGILDCIKDNESFVGNAFEKNMNLMKLLGSLGEVILSKKHDVETILSLIIQYFLEGVTKRGYRETISLTSKVYDFAVVSLEFVSHIGKD